ncbi:MAG TPA: RiPP maturation radical SAM C-methyltransferase [Pseudomonadota bacterium]|nr:RiPP maturation radical SAM C-methyltransferase [Pseudomonadota bacterium]
MIQLVNMPFGSIMRSSLALGLFKAQCVKAGLPARVHNLNFAFARSIGFGAYEMIARFKGIETQVSEWLFAEAAWRRPFGPAEDEFLRLCGNELATIPNVPDPLPWLRQIRERLVGPYLEQCVDRLTATGVPKVVAFSCMFFQTIAALALGRRLRERFPAIKLVYGGACFHGEMGEELFTKVPWIDAVSTGEADTVIVPLLQSLVAGEVPRELPGILARDPQGTTFIGPPAVPTTGEFLEGLPDPDHDEFFRDARGVGLLLDDKWVDKAAVTFEGSRGCWWGQKHHCTFCGLNAEGMQYRVKRPETTLSTVQRLASMYPTKMLWATDNIMAMSYFSEFLPQVAALGLQSNGRPIEFFYETKPNLNRAQLKALADANVRYPQPGIESLSTHLLRVMDKGVSGLQNVFFLKCATEYRLTTVWNLLIQIPQETREDYAQLVDWLPKLFHLHPPTGGPVRIECHRFSPYFHRPGFAKNIRAAKWYRGIYPDDQFDLNRVAYYFDADWQQILDDPNYDAVLAVLSDWMVRWREGAEVPRLTVRTEQDTLQIEDTRGREPIFWQLSPIQSRIYAALADISSPARIAANLAESSEAEVRGVLLQFVEQGLALREGEHFLGLALPPTEAESQFKRKIELHGFRRIERPALPTEPVPRARVPLPIMQT